MMRKAISAVLGMVASVVLASAIALFVASAQERNPATLTVSSRVYDKKQLLATPALSDDALKGRALWLQRCAFCHDGVGQPTYKTMGPWLDAEIIKSLGENVLRTIIATGTPQMPGFRYGLQPQQVDELIAFLKTVTSDQKPTPEQLAGAQGAGGSESNKD